MNTQGPLDGINAQLDASADQATAKLLLLRLGEVEGQSPEDSIREVILRVQRDALFVTASLAQAMSPEAAAPTDNRTSRWASSDGEVSFL